MSRDEIVARMEGRAFIVSYRGDGTPLGDSLALLASSAMSDVEGGDVAAGERLMRYVVRRGFRVEGDAERDLLALVRQTDELTPWLTLAEELGRRKRPPRWAVQARRILRARLGPAPARPRVPRGALANEALHLTGE